MSIPIEMVREFYGKRNYSMVIEVAIVERGINPDDLVGEYELWAAWSHHQLGSYDVSTRMFTLLCKQYPADSEIGDSSRRGLAHGLLQLGRVEDAQSILVTLAPSLARINVRSNELLAIARRGAPLPILEIRQMLDFAMWAVPHKTVCGHIVNNLTLALYEGRRHEEVQPFLMILPGLIEIAIGIYEQTKAAKNHLAGALFRASNIFLDIADWPKGALVVIDESVILWEQLVASEGGQRYQQNLEGARAQREKILARLS